MRTTGPPGFAPDRIAAGQDVDEVAVLVAEPELGFEGRSHRWRRCSGASIGEPPILGVDEPLARADVRLDLVVFVAEHLLPARGIDHVAGLEVHVPHALARAGDGQREPFLALAQPSAARRPVTSRSTTSWMVPSSSAVPAISTIVSPARVCRDRRVQAFRRGSSLA